MLQKRLLSLLKNKYTLSGFLRGYFWFGCGVVLGFFFFVSFVYITYKQTYTDKVFPGVYINNIDFGGKSREEVISYFNNKNKRIQQSKLIFTLRDTIATVSAKDLGFGFNESLLADQAYSVGRSSNTLSNMSLMLQSYMYGVHLQPAYHYNEAKLDEVTIPIREKYYVSPTNARFKFDNGRVREFQQSSNGQSVDYEALKGRLMAKTLSIVASSTPQTLVLPIPLKILRPQTTTEQVNNFGIKEIIGTGASSFVGSIPNRIYNVALAATRIDGVLVKPGEVFSFSKAVGDISTLTGYKQAYVIQNGRTVLGDGGGVCQVSTTLFRAVLNAGLPVVERNPHAYRVGYYEQDSAPGLDAAVYIPSVDFKFKNDTKHHILIRTVIDSDNARLAFELYGTKDGREVALTKPVISSVTSSPEPLYIDDPTLPKGELKQIEHAVSGATVKFSREVKKNGEVVTKDTFSSYYKAWQAVYMRGTKEG